MSEFNSINSIVELAPSIITGSMAVAGIIYANWHNAKMAKINAAKEFSKRKLDKIEELYLVLSQYKKYVLKISLSHTTFYAGHLTRQELQAQLDECKTGQSFDLVNARMLVDVYFDEIKPQFEVLDKAWGELAPLFLLEANSTNSRDAVINVMAKQEAFEQVCDKLLIQLGRLAKNL
ncbi:hypothetical protein KUH14_004668 [Vibrio parahaemolyticus]|nr:hypothetical protein [Vibrio parahaemolyticus]EHR0831492.1 hypothetical protein [Vibrio parahaemolyticus]EHR1160680.1 hypothetical protein [Vibrio parahaemolyticus]EHR5011281.1 hypothetical protein [Vibrio parahaemolyticus]ELB2172880.1 hypothetical protein [Vibrio parahaemolyticus]